MTARLHARPTPRKSAMTRQVTADWKHAMVAALLCEGRGAAELLEMAAAKFDENDQTRGIANLFRDRAGDLRLAPDLSLAPEVAPIDEL